MNYRQTIVAGSICEARDQLRELAEGARNPVRRTPGTAPKVAFVCTGMGPQWWRMCRGLLDEYPAFAESIARSDRELARYTGWSLIDELKADETCSRMDETDVAQPANFAIQIALAAQLKEFGIEPDAVIGHSAGEVAAHYLAGVLTFEQAIRVIYHRSRLQQRTSGLGRMLAVGLNVESLMQAIDDTTLADMGRRVAIAAVNSPTAVTVAGDADVLDDIARQLDERKIFHRFLPVTVPYHTHYMDAVKDDLLAALDGLSSLPATVPLYSTVTGERLERYATGAAYWWQNTRATVLFEPAMRRMLDDGYTHFVELGPHPVLATSVAEIAQQADVVVLATQRRDSDDGHTLMSCVGALHCHGYRVAWEALNPRQDARLVKLPSYPWQSKRYWNETQEAIEDLHYNPVHPLLGQPITAVHPTWEVELSAAGIPFLADHQVQGSVLVPGAVYIEMALAAAEQVYASTDHCVDNLRLHRAVIIDDTCDPVLRTTLNQDTGTLEFAAFTATAGGELKWTITATAELNTLPRVAQRADTVSGAGPVTVIEADEFYRRTRAVGLAYGEAFQTVAGVTAGNGWVTAQLTIPSSLAAEVGNFRFHPALIDGAFQILLGTPLFDSEANDSPFLPVRIRRSAVYGPAQQNMTAQVRVISAGEDEIESDITITGEHSEPLAFFHGFTVRSLGAASRMSAERVDKGLLELQWIPNPGSEDGQREKPSVPGTSSWLIFTDGGGFGATLAEQMRRSGQRVHTVAHQPVDTLTQVADGYVLNPRQPRHLPQLLETHLENEGNLAGIIDCWPLDTHYRSDGDGRTEVDGSETYDDIGVFTILHLVKALVDQDTVQPRLYLVTAKAQPVLPADVPAAEQAAVWGLGRVIGHQEFVKHWGGLIDIDDGDDHLRSAELVCEHILDDDPEDQIAVRGGSTFVPRLRSSTKLTKAFPTKLTPDATYVVTGGAGALGRVVATYLAERGARHIALLCRTEIPTRSQWAQLPHGSAHHATIETIRKVERTGARVTTASVDITDADQVKTWLSNHSRRGGPPVRGIFHAAGSVDDQLLVNMTEADFTRVMAPKVRGTRVLHETFLGHDLDFFVMFGSAGSVIASPGQGNYAAANAFLDAFAHYRRAQGLAALTIGWGPWSVGMVAELKLEKIYAQRGIELITPAAGGQILDRLINQKLTTVIAISADWTRVRQGIGARLPRMFSELGIAESSPDGPDSASSILELLSACPKSDRLGLVARQVRQVVSAVFDLAVTDIEPDYPLDDLGLDSMMAMDFRSRINALFAIDVPVLELLRGVSVNSLAVRVLAELEPASAELDATTAAASEPTNIDDVDRLIEQMSEADLREVLAALEGPSTGHHTPQAHVSGGR
jgi:malonyl CoA-acyl carrier protein transacylase/NAD(P)-dependent dehydrogenase (short-subunit alcohol dehydrogenase family)/acyl carrier protein